MDLSSGQLLLHYRLVERIGEGGMGVVWRAIDTTLERDVAIKILPPAFATDPERLTRFEREAKLLASLNHPNIAAVYGLHTHAGVRFLAMELVRGPTLSQEIAQGMAPGRVIEVAIAIADALSAAHRQRVVHRDLKPDNIMIDADGRPKVLDFGLAKLGAAAVTLDAPTMAPQSSPTQQGAVLGTVAYMSPEQAQGKNVDPRSDIFSLGVVLYEMATGRRPFVGDNSVSILTAILRDSPKPITNLQPMAPAHLERIVGRCLEKPPAARYADASELREDLRTLQNDLASDPGRSAVRPRPGRGRRIGVGVLLAIVLGAIGALWLRQDSRERWVRRQALPQLEELVDNIQGLEEGRESWDAFLLAEQIDAAVSADPLLERLRPKFTRAITIRSDPPGATVHVRYYDEPTAQPLLIGTTPLERVGFPRGFSRVELSLPGRPALQDVIWNFGLIGDSWEYRFPHAGELPDGMVYVGGGAFELYLPGLEGLAAEPTAPFAMDRLEVTNAEFKRFVDAGGYADPKYWQHPFVDVGADVTFQQAMSRFVDRTGRTGPATWDVGSYPEGRAEHPVSGVSWYEAAAYAQWAGKSLPTIFHWNRVAFTVASSRIVPLANLNGDGTVPVGSTNSMNRYGVHDLAGNVREWAWNRGGEQGQRFILGGGWNDPDYAFTDAYAQPPFDRSITNGFRCIRHLEPEPNLERLQRAIGRPTRDFRAERPVDDEAFAQYLRLFAYDKAPLNAAIEEERPTPHGLRQKISFAAAYGGERMLAYLFLPPVGAAPYQVVVVFPGSGAITTRSSESLDLGRVDWLTKSGRAVMYPIYKGTFERGGELQSDIPNMTTAYKDYVIMWGKDLSRSIDYLESRADIDSPRLAYYGLSWGGALGAILPAVETRIRANILYVAGLNLQRALPEADQINYVTRVKQPTLILNGELDFFFPVESAQRPMFDLLGTPAEHKKRLVFPGGHSVPRTEMIRESLLWLDRYLGQVPAGAGS